MGITYHGRRGVAGQTIRNSATAHRDSSGFFVDHASGNPCTQDSDGCAAEGDCPDSQAEVSGSFESSGDNCCFSSCEKLRSGRDESASAGNSMVENGSHGSVKVAADTRFYQAGRLPFA
jgi:hypothetical protein